MWEVQQSLSRKLKLTSFAGGREKRPMSPLVWRFMGRVGGFICEAARMEFGDEKERSGNGGNVAWIRLNKLAPFHYKLDGLVKIFEISKIHHVLNIAPYSCIGWYIITYLMSAQGSLFSFLFFLNLETIRMRNIHPPAESTRLLFSWD